MTPSPGLGPFRRDHHEELIHAQRLVEEGASGLAEFRRSWDATMRDHLNEEERLLLPLCDPGTGVRLQADHRQIETLVDTAATDEEARRLGRLILDHAQWEERELYRHVERSSPATLQSLAAEARAIERKREDRPPDPQPPAGPPMADLRYLADVAPARGAQWGMESDDLNATLLVWQAGEGVPTHVNEEVDVLVVAVEGQGEVRIDGRVFLLASGQTLLIPKGVSRSMVAKTHRFAHLNVHRRRHKLAVGKIPKKESP